MSRPRNRWVVTLAVAAALVAGCSACSHSSAGGASSGTLKIGLMYSPNANSSIAATGAKTREPDFQQIQNAVLAYINSHGGIGGQQASAVYNSVAATATAQQVSQGACTEWTQDNRVTAAIPSQASEDNGLLRQCLGSAGVLSIYAGSYSTATETQFGQSPLWFEPDTLSLEKMATTYVAGLQQTGFLGGTKIGVVYDQTPSFSSVAQSTLMPALRSAGADVVDTFTQNVHSVADLGSGAAAMGSAVLKFHSDGVTNVIFFDSWAPAWALFAIAAQSQHWTPVYGFSSQDVPQDAIDTGLVPKAQLQGAKLVGWNASYDVAASGAGSWTRLSLCKQILDGASIPLSAFSVDGYAGALSVCGALLDLQDAGKTAAKPLTAALLAQALAGLGSQLQSANWPDVQFGPQRHYGISAWRPGAYVAACNCFQYNGAATKF